MNHDIGELTRAWAQSCNLDCDYFPELGSTNDHAKTLEINGTRLIVTSYQPNGRGRNENTWTSPKNGNALLSSWCFQTEENIQPILSPLCGLAVYRSLKQVWGEESFSIKAPNDIYLGNKKIAGLLVEVSSIGNHQNIIIGLGLNVTSVPDVPNSGSLIEIQKKAVSVENWQEFLESLLVEFTSAIASSSQPELSPSVQNDLKAALNAYPLLESPIEEVLPDGGMITKDGLISWREL